MKRNEDKIKLDLQQQDKQQPEVTPQLRDQVQEMLAFVTGEADDLARKAKELKEARKKEEIELQSGEVVLFETYLAEAVQEYAPKFPNDNPFFAELFRLAGWKDKDPKRYVKPLAVKHWLVETIYYRFHKDALPALKAKAQPGKHKLFQLLTDEGQSKLIQFRDEAVAMMKKFPDGAIYEFRMAYSEEYKTAVQLKLHPKL